MIFELCTTQYCRVLYSIVYCWGVDCRYGARIRAPHALVMTFLFGSGTLIQKLMVVLKLTRMHATNLAKFVFSYKLLTGIMEKVQHSRSQWHSFVAAFAVGYFVFGENNGVNMQINLYLLSDCGWIGTIGCGMGLHSPTPFPCVPLVRSCRMGRGLVALRIPQRRPSTVAPKLHDIPLSRQQSLDLPPRLPIGQSPTQTSTPFLTPPPLS